VKHPVTSDGRYFVVRGRLWRMANPDLGEAERTELVSRLMAARRSVRDAKESDDREAEAAAHKVVEQSSIGQSPNTNDLPTSAAEPFFGRAAGPVFVECLQIGFEDFLAVGELDSKH
jgi:hypothetical protein